MRGGLCHRCGAVLGPVEVPRDGRQVEVTCPDCGLTVTHSALVPGGPGGRRGVRGAPVAGRDGPAEAIRARPFPLFGLDPAWPGPRWPGGFSAQDGRTTSVTLGHGATEDNGPWVRVTTTPTPVAPDPLASRPGVARAQEARSLVHALFAHSGERTDAMHRTFTAPDPTTGWDRIQVSVDGEPTAFHAVHSRTWWAAMAERPDVRITVVCHDTSPQEMQLVTVADVRPYLPEPA